MVSQRTKDKLIMRERKKNEKEKKRRKKLNDEKNKNNINIFLTSFPPLTNTSSFLLTLTLSILSLEKHPKE